MEYSVCSPQGEKLTLELCECKHVCRYHKFPTRTRYTNALIAPEGLCIDLFHSAYPYCLSLLYGARYDHPITVSCPNPKSNVQFEIITKPTKTRILRRLLVKVAALFGWAIECPDLAVILVAKKNSDKNCLYPYSAGQKFTFNLWLKRELCPATFDSVYPAVHNLLRGKVTQFLKTVRNRVVCPDPKSCITLAMKNQNE